MDQGPALDWIATSLDCGWLGLPRVKVRRLEGAGCIFASGLVAVLARGFAPGDAVFVDDAPKNVEAARAVGMDAVHFTGPALLREALVARGLLAPLG